MLALLLGSGFEQEVRDRKSMAQCLKNLRVIGAALQMYSAEDSIEQVIPIHQSTMVRSGVHVGGTLRSFVRPWAWGGASGTTRFPLNDTGAGFFVNESDPVGSFYASATRPLRHYVAGDPFSNEPEPALIFECPADVGYPKDPRIDDMLGSARGIPLFGMLGNSYRHSMFSAFGGGNTQFSYGAYGHRLSSLTGLDRQLLLGDPLLFNMIGINASPDPDPIPLTGWHGEVLADNALYADASARWTNIERLGRITFPDEPSADSLAASNRQLLFRTSAFKLDCYPTPGAAINTISAGQVLSLMSGFLSSQWPLLNYENNLPAQ
ncbi:MAG: hypothetical protein SF069_09430 [Phycisphaerae bacterium]|nr:hypothetical protein [Phycisphaerae bacterium]